MCNTASFTSFYLWLCELVSVGSRQELSMINVMCGCACVCMCVCVCVCVSVSVSVYIDCRKTSITTMIWRTRRRNAMKRNANNRLDRVSNSLAALSPRHSCPSNLCTSSPWIFFMDVYIVHILYIVYGEDGGGGHWLVRMEWHPAGWSVCLRLLIFPCTIKSRSSLLAPAYPGSPGKRP